VTITSSSPRHGRRVHFDYSTSRERSNQSGHFPNGSGHFARGWPRSGDLRAAGDSVTKGQLLLQVQSADMSAAFSDYRKALADEQLARTQLERSKLLYDKGAISLNDLQVAQDSAEKAS